MPSCCHSQTVQSYWQYYCTTTMLFFLIIQFHLADAFIPLYHYTVNNYKEEVRSLKKGIIFVCPKQHWIKYCALVRVDHCPLGGTKQKKSVLCVMPYQFVCLWWAWNEDDQWGESGLYLLPYLFLCAPKLAEHYTEGQEAVNKVGLKFYIVCPPSLVTTKQTSSVCSCNQRLIRRECSFIIDG